MKKYFIYPIGVLISSILFIVFSVLLVLFIKPGLVINTDILRLVLEKTSIFKNYDWKEGHLDIKWNKWNDRRIIGDFEDFCFVYQSATAKASSCIDKLSFKMDLSWNMEDGFHINSIEPLTVRSDHISVTTFDGEPSSEKDPPPDIWNYWQLLWSDLIPDMVINVSQIKIHQSNEPKPFVLDLKLMKNEKSLLVESKKFKLAADPDKVVITGPEKYRLTDKGKLKKPLDVSNLKLVALMNENGIPLEAGGKLDGIEVSLESFIDLPLKNHFSSMPFRKSAFLKTKGRVFINDVKKVIHAYAPSPYDKLPAPLNVMNGTVEFLLDTSKMDNEFVLIKTKTAIDLSGKKQVLNLSVLGDIPLNVMNFSRGLIQIGVDFSKVIIQLPRLSKKSPPPQFFPDGRFKTSKEALKPDNHKKPNISFDLEALEEKALHVSSNLLDEALRLNFDLKIRKSEVQSGFLKVLPLKTSIFKRPIRIRHLIIKFNHPLDPVIESKIQFPLPEYKITLNLEGPVSDPRYTFTSNPPLPKNDIYAVLLFGRPLADLGPDDRNAAQETNKILAQGILSLSVLYFLSGSPVEYIGYDPDTGRATAQVGIDSKTSLRVGAGEGGGSTGVRRSLGKGWYLDTSVQRNANPSSDDVRDYGVLLERIIAY